MSSAAVICKWFLHRAARHSLAAGLVLVLPVMQAAHASESVFMVDNDDGLLLSDRVGLPDAVQVVRGIAEPQAPRKAAASKTPLRFTGLVEAAARQHRLPPALLHAVIAVESGYAVNAVSRRGAMGLMQLMPTTAREHGVTQPFDPAQNVNAGASYLRRLLDQFGGDTRVALAAYNAGAGAVRRHGGGIPPFAETQDYVPRVLRHMAQQTGGATLN